MIRAEYPSPVGVLTLVADEIWLMGLYFEQHKGAGPPSEASAGASNVLDAAARQLDAYFAGRARAFDLTLAPRGTPFQHRVWRALQRIAYAETRSYGAIAEEVGAPAAVRAVAAAIGRNPVSILIPCHRVVGKSGALTGYAGGLARKAFLLGLESDRGLMRA